MRLFCNFLHSLLIVRVNSSMISLASNFKESTFSDSQGWSVSFGAVGFGIIDNGNSIFGGINYFDTISQVQRLFVFPPHYRIRVQITVWTFGKWSDGRIALLCEEKFIFSQQLYTISNYQAPFSLDVVTVHNADTALIQIRPSVQNQGNQQWGIRDFSLFYYPCPEGCVTCTKSDTFVTCSLWTKSFSHWTDLSITDMTNEGWFINDDNVYFRFNQCNGVPVFGYYSSGMDLKRTFYLDTHSRMRIQFLFVKLNNWDASTFYLSVDNIIQKEIKDTTDEYHNINYCDSDQGFDSISRVDFEFPHSNQLSEIKIYTTLSSTQLMNQFGIRDFTIYIQKCNSCVNTGLSFSNDPISYFTQASFSDSEGWIVQQAVDTQKIFLCGDKSLYGTFGMQEHIHRTLSLTPHSKLILTMTIYCIDSWDNEILYIRIDGNLIQTNQFGPWDGIDICGSGYPEKLVYFSYLVDHVSNSITIDLTTTLDEIISNESFGMRDFRLQLGSCPFDCNSCNLVSGDYCQLVYRDEYHELNEQTFVDIGGWKIRQYLDASPVVTQCNGLSILGGEGSISGQSSIKLTQILPDHQGIRIILKVYIIGDWTLEDSIIINIDGIQLYNKAFTQAYSNFECSPSIKGYIINFDKVIIHSSLTLTLEVTNNIPLYPSTNSNYLLVSILEAYGVRDVEIYYFPA